MKTMSLEKLQEKEIWDFVGTFIKDPYSPQFDYVIFNIDRLAAKVKFDRYPRGFFRSGGTATKLGVR